MLSFNSSCFSEAGQLSSVQLQYSCSLSPGWQELCPLAETFGSLLGEAWCACVSVGVWLGRCSHPSSGHARVDPGWLDREFSFLSSVCAGSACFEDRTLWWFWDSVLLMCSVLLTAVQNEGFRQPWQNTLKEWILCLPRVRTAHRY